MTLPTLRAMRVQFEPTGSRWLRRLAAGLVAIGLLGAAPLSAQDSELRALADQIDRLQRELTTLQQDFYRSGAVTSATTTEEYGTTQAARFDQRLRGLEQALRDLTGQLEQQVYKTDQLSNRLDRLVADVDFRLQRIEGGTTPGQDPALGASSQSQGAEPATGASQSVSGQTGAAAASVAGSGAVGSSTPGVIGTITPEELAAAQAQAPAQGQAAGTQSAALPTGTAQQQYDEAFRLLSQARYDEAEVALNGFLQAYPQDALAGNAKYWLGETYYVRGQYAEAAVAFAEGFQNYPDSVKAPDNLLKLGKSLAELGQTSDACDTFAELLRRYSNAAPTILQQAERDRQRLSCA